MMLEELQRGLTSNLELIFEHGNSCWKALDEQKMMEISRRGFKMMEESKILMPHPLKRYLRGWVCYIEIGVAQVCVVPRYSTIDSIPIDYFKASLGDFHLYCIKGIKFIGRISPINHYLCWVSLIWYIELLRKSYSLSRIPKWFLP
jgi:hypothetical protein